MNKTDHREEEFDAIIIGAGQAGNPLAVKLSENGWKTAVIETKFAGGTCVNYGCTPTKTMIASAKVAYLARRAADYGVSLENINVNMAKVKSRKDEIVKAFRDGVEKGLEEIENLEIIYGEARFSKKKTVEVTLKGNGKRILKAEKIFINAGARPDVPEIAGLNKINFLDSTTILDLKELPEHLVVIGGGYIGLEFGQMFKRFGSKVTILEKAERLAKKEDADISDELKKIFEEDGIQVLCTTEVNSVHKESDLLKIKVKSVGARNIITGSHVLISSGRIPNTEALDLQKAGVEIDDKKHIKVNEKLETSAEGIYALGDIKGGPAFTHISYDDYRIVSENILNNKNKNTTERIVPYCLFTDPQLARVGLTETQAKEKGYNIKIAKLPMEKAARAIETGETRGMMKVVIDATNNQILGAAILSVEGGEIMSGIQIAMMAKIPYTILRDSVFAHPTLMESLNNLFSNMKE